MSRTITHTTTSTTQYDYKYPRDIVFPSGKRYAVSTFEVTHTIMTDDQDMRPYTETKYYIWGRLLKKDGTPDARSGTDHFEIDSEAAEAVMDAVGN